MSSDYFPSDDEFPELEVLLKQVARDPKPTTTCRRSQSDKQSPAKLVLSAFEDHSQSSPLKDTKKADDAIAPKTPGRRRRKLGQREDSHLLMPLSREASGSLESSKRRTTGGSREGSGLSLPFGNQLEGDKLETKERPQTHTLSGFFEDDDAPIRHENDDIWEEDTRPPSRAPKTCQGSAFPKLKAPTSPLSDCPNGPGKLPRSQTYSATEDIPAKKISFESTGLKPTQKESRPKPSPKKTRKPDSSESPEKRPSKRDTAPKAKAREAKKLFEARKHDMAASFLKELDEIITEGQLEKLAASTGGVSIHWTTKLNTTAGRAKWKRETVKEQTADGTVKTTTEHHHACIELAGKVIDDEHRLLNVIAHEFCHLANFMVSGITGNPHGKEFKAWASKVSRAFGDRGIEVTTKHSYDIDFKYVWECNGCGVEYKRHSKSINPERHRCGVCKSQLQQTRPAPRATNGKKSEYQIFLQAQMRAVKEEQPKMSQKDVMRLVAQKWAERAKAAAPAGPPGSPSKLAVDEVAGDLDGLIL